MSSPELLATLARRPDHPWWIGDGAVITRGAAADRVAADARGLHAAGWRPGQRLALAPSPDAACVASLLAALAAGVDVLLLPLRELPARRRELAARAGAAFAETALGATAPAVPPAPAARSAPPGPGGGRVWLRSSGSLGRPRWVAHETPSLLAIGALGADALGFGAGATWSCTLPLDHASGFAPVVRALAGGGALLAPGAAGAATHCSLVPTQLARAVAAGEAARLRAHRVLLLGGAALSPGLRRRCLDEGLPVVASYGLSETCGMVAAGRDRLGEPGWSGRPLPGWRCAVGEDGGLRLAGPGLCAAVAGDDGALVPPPLPEGMLETGDLARLEPDGAVVILGRRDNVIVTGGEKLPAEELEAALEDLDGVEAAVVVPFADAQWGQRPAAFVRFAAGRARPLASVREELAPTVAAWKLPVALWPLPEGEGLKPDRAALARLAAGRSHR